MNRRTAHSIAWGLLILSLFTGCSEGPEAEHPPYEISGAALGLRDVDLRDLVPGCASDDCYRSLTEVEVVPTSSVDFLEGDDWIVAVEVDGMMRAYPLALLWWHQGVHDEVAGRPIFVSHSSLTGSSLVFRASHGGENRVFGVSKRFYNSSTIYYYREDGSDDQVLLPQLYTASVTGTDPPEDWPRIDAREMMWSTWQVLHPEGDVATLETGYNIDYDLDPFASYRLDQELILSPLSEPPDSRFPWKERTLLVRSGSNYRAYPSSTLTGRGAPVEQVLNGVAFAVEMNARGEFTVASSVPAADLESYVAFWFACAAFHPGIEVFKPVP
jgi:hypothetical protein